MVDALVMELMITSGSIHGVRDQFDVPKRHKTIMWFLPATAGVSHRSSAGSLRCGGQRQWRDFFWSPILVRKGSVSV